MDTLRTWAYSVPAPDPLEEGAVEPKELESARKAREAIAAKAAAAAEQAQAAAAPAEGAGAPPQPATVGEAPAAAPPPEAPAVEPGSVGTAEAGEPAAAQADAEHLEIEVDQETYDRLIAAGEPERTARAKAKAAYARKLRAAQRGQS
jgi:hypothetical protein